ncbi:MAG: hypothetical protein K6U79_07815 [Firmicutes bacterium]|nr:hypothetical protein [Bacillota bacterium]
MLAVLVVVALLGLTGSALVALWMRSVLLAQRHADEVAALYAAEAGIAEGAKQLAAGDGQPFSGYRGVVGSPPWTASFTVSAGPDGQGGFLLTSQGEKGSAVRTVRVRLATPFLFPFYAGRTLNLSAESWIGRGTVYFDAVPAYGTAPGAGYNIRGNFFMAGTSQPVRPVQVSMALPAVPFSAFASLAGSPPPAPAPLSPVKGAPWTLAAGWYQAPEECDGADLVVPDGATVGILGSLSCDRAQLQVGKDATLVVTGDLVLTRTKPTSTSLLLENGGRIVVGGNVSVASVQALSVSPLATGGGGLLVAGGAVDIQNISLANVSTGTSTLAILALDRRGCSARACGPDSSNDITIDSASLVSASRGATLDLVAYSAPLPGASNPPKVELALNSFVSVGTTQMTAAVVSAGDVRFSVGSLIDLSTMEISPNPRGLMTFSSLAPGAGLWTQLSWDEGGS